MRVQTEESRPVGEGGNPKDQVRGRSTAKTTGLDPVAALATADHALLVTRSIRGGGIRRRVLFSLPSAQAAVARAEAAGHAARVTLVQLRPVGHLDLDDLGEVGER